MSSFLEDIIPFAGPILGVIGSLFKGKKAKYTTTQNPQQAQAYQMLLNQLMQRMRSGQQSPVQQAGNQSMNQLSQMFYGTSFPQQQQQAMPNILKTAANNNRPVQG